MLTGEILSAVLFIAAASQMHDVDHHNARVGILIPLYIYPDDQWESIVHEKRTHHFVPITVIVNPSNGPGIQQDQNYAVAIKKL